MKKYITLIIAILIAAVSFAQNGINYKAVVKDNSGNILSSSPVTIQFIIYEGVALTDNVYQESHTSNTDMFEQSHLSMGHCGLAESLRAGIDGGE